MSIFLSTAEIGSLKLGNSDVSRVMLGNTEVWSAVDPDAADYFARIVSAGSSISASNRAAVDAFIRGCKADGIWSAIKASCLLAGPDDLTGALVPLVGAAPTNVNFVSGDYNRTTGLIGDGSTKYLKSNRNNNDDPQNSKHLAAWLSNTVTGTKCVLGSGVSALGNSQLIQTSSKFFRINYAIATSAGSSAYESGFCGASRSDATGTSWRNGTSSGFFTDAGSAPTSSTLNVFSRDGTSYTDHRIAYYSIGEAINLAALDARLATYMSALT